MNATHHHKVLLVEDDPDCRESLKALLESEGYDVTTAGDGLQALHKVREQQRDLCAVLLDLMLPVQDGRWFRRQQLSDPDLAAVPVVVMSGAGQVDLQAQQLGVQDYVAKPVEPEQLCTILARNCR